MNPEENYAAAKHFSPALWKRIIPYVTRNKKRFLFVMGMMMVSAVLDSIIPQFTRYAINNFVVPATTKGIGRFIFLFTLMCLAQSTITVLFSRQSMVIEMETGRDMKRDCFLHLQKLPLAYYNHNSVGYILARVMSDTNRIGSTIGWGMVGLVYNIFYLIFIAVNMFLLNAKLALMVMAVIPFIFAVSLYFMPRLLKSRREMRHASSLITGAFNEDITGAKTAKTLVIEDRLNKDFQGLTKGMYSASMYNARLNALFNPITSFLGSLAVAIAFYYSGIRTISGELDFGIMSAFIGYSISVLGPIASVARTFANMMDTQVNIERMTHLLDEPITIQDTPEIEAAYGDVLSPKPENYPPVKGDILFDHVWFRYPDAPEDDWVLQDILLHVPAGANVAIVGETGAGKSTLVNLACRFFEPTKGRILIDGVDYRERSQHWLHSNLGYVQQDPHLFSGSIMENIRYGRLDATDEEVKAAARLVSADKVAEKMENGYDTEVGEGGDRLSTGEKQLVSFARAVLADPPLFILDEATSSIDTETERLIQDAIGHVLTGRTSFIIAHRLSTIRNADIILLVDEHGIAEMGSHKELMALGGQYCKLYNAMKLRDRSESAGF